MSPLQEQTWESFSQNWNVDVAQAFHWIRHALQRPLAPGSTVIAVSSGAAIKGSPLSGGYAGAKATVRLIAGYAALESERAGLGIDFVSVLPALTPATELGAKAVAAYAERQGVDVDTFVQSLGPALTAEQVGKSVLDIAIGQQRGHRAYTLTAAGLSPLGEHAQMWVFRGHRLEQPPEAEASTWRSNSHTPTDKSPTTTTAPSGTSTEVYSSWAVRTGTGRFRLAGSLGHDRGGQGHEEEGR